MPLVFFEGGGVLDKVSFTVYCYNPRETPIDESYNEFDLHRNVQQVINLIILNFNNFLTCQL